MYVRLRGLYLTLFLQGSLELSQILLNGLSGFLLHYAHFLLNLN